MWKYRASINYEDRESTPEFEERANTWIDRIGEKISRNADAGATIGGSAGFFADAAITALTGVNTHSHYRETGEMIGKVVGGAVGAVSGVVEEGARAVGNVVKNAWNGLRSIFG